MSGGISFASIATAVAGAVAASVVTKALAPKGGSGMAMQTTAAAPAAEAPTVMPSTTDATSSAAKRASISAQMARRGRASTILTDTTPGETLGG